MEFHTDLDGYPTDNTLGHIEHWPFEDIMGVFDFIRPYFDKYGRINYFPEDNKWELSTGGWSGCESIIDSMMKNPVISAVLWQSSHRGGLHKFAGMTPHG